MKDIVYTLILLGILSCKQSPPDVAYLSLRKKTNDTLLVRVRDHFTYVDDYLCVVKNDTLSINVYSVYSPNKHLDDKSTVIPKEVKYIKLQDSLVYHRDSVDWMPAIYILSTSWVEAPEKILSFKYNNPEFNVVETPLYQNKNNYLDKVGSLYPSRFYFYLPTKDVIIYCESYSIGSNSKEDSYFNFIRVTKDGKRWRKINTYELSKEENEEYKEILEKEILDKLGVGWKRR